MLQYSRFQALWIWYLFVAICVTKWKVLWIGYIGLQRLNSSACGKMTILKIFFKRVFWPPSKSPCICLIFIRFFFFFYLVWEIQKEEKLSVESLWKVSRPKSIGYYFILLSNLMQRIFSSIASCKRW